MNKEQLKQDIKDIEAKLQNMKQQLMESYMEDTQEEYPIFKRNRFNKSIVKFVELNKHIRIIKANSNYTVGEVAKHTTPHTDTEIWEDIAYDKERDLFDGQPVYCWDSSGTHIRRLKFYDAINKLSFTYDGNRNGSTYSNYEAVKQEHYTDWMLEAFETLKR